MARCRSEWDELQLPLDPLDLIADPDFPIILVYITPAQPKHFATAQAVEQQQHERGIERVISKTNNGSVLT